MSTQPKPAAAKPPAKSAPAKAQGSQPQQPQQPGRKRAVGVREELDELKEIGPFGLWLRSLVESTPGLTTSLIVHAVLLILLALITLPDVLEKVVPNLLATTETEKEEVEKLDENIEVVSEDINVSDEVSEVVDTEVVKEEMEISSFNDAPAAPISVETSDFGLEHVQKNNLMNKMGSTTGKGFDGRGQAARKAMLASEGGTGGSEAAVGHALKWLAEHQMVDGGWSFNHGINNKHVGPVNDPGSAKTTTGATAMALLPFLGAGQTHKEGKYKETIQRGLYYLGRQMKVTANGGDLMGEGGSMYAHGLASIVLCEAYALTQDKALAQPAQQSINFIVYAQDKTGGGWRYSPGQPGDTSAVGWQIMALKSGHLAYLDVPPKTIAGAINFLNLVQSNSGANYGYTGPGAGPATTGCGLLCRMYLGWKQDNPALQAGVQYMSKLGPSKNNMYFNYYATQVLHHWGGEEWKKWNAIMREQLIASQVQAGTYTAEKGSWWTVGQSHGEAGGRLYETSMSCMTLEVYYRHMPLYRQNAAAGDDF